MSFCPHCGATNADGVNFCASCGTQLTAAYQRNPSPPYSHGLSSASANSVLAVVKRACSSPIALIALIAYSAAILLNLLNGFFYGLSGTAGYVIIFENIENAMFFRIASVAINIFAITRDILSIVLVTNLWIIYASAADRRSAGMKAKSLMTIKTILKIYFVFIFIALALLGIAVVVISVMNVIIANGQGAGDSFSLILALAIGFRLFVLFYTDLIETIDAIHKTIQTGIPSENISSYVAIISLIPGVLTAVAILLAIILYIIAIIVDGAAVTPALANLVFVNPLSSLASLCTIIASFAFGVFLFHYRNKIRTAGR